jgi:hypothetical protein
MTPQLFEAYQAEIRGVEAQIENERQALSTEDDREEAERLRFRVRNLSKVLKTLKTSLNAIVLGESEVEALQVKFSRWRDLRLAARAAQDEMDRLAKKVGPARAACTPAQNRAARCEAELAQHRERLLPQYVTEPELARQAATEQKLKKVYEEALAEWRNLTIASGQAQSEWAAAAQKFDAACFKERMARLPSEEPAASKFSRVA